MSKYHADQVAATRPDHLTDAEIADLFEADVGLGILRGIRNMGSAAELSAAVTLSRDWVVACLTGWVRNHEDWAAGVERSAASRGQPATAATLRKEAARYRAAIARLEARS